MSQRRPATDSKLLNRLLSQLAGTLSLPPFAGQELSRVPIPSRFTHDVVRTGDDVFVCDTGNGRVLQLSFPDMKPVSYTMRLRACACRIT